MRIYWSRFHSFPETTRQQHLCPAWVYVFVRRREWWRVFNLGLVVGREYLGTTLHRGVVILEVFRNLLHWMGAAAGWGMERLTWTEVECYIKDQLQTLERRKKSSAREEQVERLRNANKHTVCWPLHMACTGRKREQRDGERDRQE